MVINQKFWQGKKVLLTGHTGFKGAWLSLWLKNLGARVVGLSLAPPTTTNLFSLARIKNGMISLKGDVRDKRLIGHVIKTHRPEIIFHMAAQAYLNRGYEDPYHTYTTNIVGTLNILETCRILGREQVLVNVTSDKCYENNEERRSYKESDSLGGSDPYSNSKACSDLMTQAYLTSFFSEPSKQKVGVATARAGNVIGGGDWAPNRLIPDCMDAWTHKKPVLIRHPNAIRPWQHVLNSLSGYLLLAEKLHANRTKYSGAWNFGPRHIDCQTVRNVVARLKEKWGSPVSYKVTHRSFFKEKMKLHLDSSKAIRLLNWHPVWSLTTALDKTAEWYHAYQSKENMEKVCSRQISEFEAGL